MAWTTFVNSTTADADEVNGNFDFLEGTIVPFDSAGTSTDNTFDLGSSSFRWRAGYFNSINAGSIVVSGTTSLLGTLSVTGITSLGGNLSVTGEIGLSGGLKSLGQLNAAVILISTTSSFRGDVGIGRSQINGTRLTVFNATENSIIRLETDKVDGDAEMNFLNDVQSWRASIRGGDLDSFIIRNAQIGDDVMAFTIGGLVGVQTNTPSNTLDVSGTFGATGNTTLGGTLSVTGVTTLGNNLSVGGTLSVTGITSLGNNLSVTGDVGVSGNIVVSGNVDSDGQVDFAAQPQAKSRVATSFTITAGQILSIPFNTIEYNIGGIATTTGSGTFFIPTSGIYSIDCGIEVSGTSTGSIQFAVQTSGLTVLKHDFPIVASLTFQHFGDVKVRLSSGASISIVAANPSNNGDRIIIASGTFLSIYKLP